MDNKIKEIRTRMGLSQDEFCKRLAIPKTTYLRYESGERDAPVKVMAKIARLANVSMEYIVYGEDESYDNAPQNLASDMVVLNLYEDIYASAGYGTENSDTRPTPMTLGRAFLEKVLGITCFKKLDIIRVSGDSMLPLIQDGEYIIVERETDARNGDTVIANINGELYVKRLHKEPFSEWVRLESENKEYLPIEINTPERLECLKIIGVVRSKIKLF
ncbi:MAG: S24 family peptidase [Wolinella sp.]